MTGARAAALVAAAALPPAAVALASGHLDDDALLAVSTTCAALACGALAIQPLLATRAVRAHRAAGMVILALVGAHVALLFVLAPDDALFAMSPDGPTRARMALIATCALIAAAVLGIIGLDRATWRILHAYLAFLVITLGIGHALLTDGALDGAGTPLLLVLAGIGLAGIVAALVLDARRAR